MDIELPMPDGISEENRLLHFQGIAPLRESFSMDVLILWSDGTETAPFGSIHSYGFGAGIDESGLIEVGASEQEKRREAPPSYDVFVEVPSALAGRLAAHPTAKLIGRVAETAIAEAGMNFSVQDVQAKPLR